MKKQIIVVGVDFSECSLLAVREGARLADRWGRELHLIHIVNQEFFEREVDESYLTEEVVLKAAQDALEKVVTEVLGSETDFHCYVAAGHPIYGLLDRVKEVEADFLVLGRQGNHVKTARDPGSDSRRVATYASCSVLLVDPHRPSSDSVLACADFSESAKLATDMAAKLAVESGRVLHLLHIVPALDELRGPYYGLTMLEEGDYERLSKREEKKIEEQADALRTKYPELKVETIFEAGTGVPFLICKKIEQVKAGLVVLGASGNTGLLTKFLGTTAERVNQDCACSVLTVRG